MDLIDKLVALASKIEKSKESIQTEEATKNAFVLPFLSALGYDVFDPHEVIPEFTADVGTKKGEKVDYAIMQEGKLILLIECKKVGAALDRDHASQLYRYYSVTEARVGILTDGIRYQFYADLEEKNKMDQKPFFEFEMTSVDDQIVHEVKKFSKSAFNLDELINSASDLKYTKEIKAILAEQLNSPSEDFVKYFGAQIHDGILTPTLKKQFAPIVKRAFQQFISEKVNDRLKSALATDPTDLVIDEQLGRDSQPDDQPKGGDREIVTTVEELEGFFLVKSILRDLVEPTRIGYRDSLSYFSIILDDSNRKTVCRLWFNGNKKFVGLFDEQKAETKHVIGDLNDIYAHAESLRTTLKRYLDGAAKKE